MQSVTITLSDELKQVAEEQVVAGRFKDISAFFEALIGDYERRKAEAHLEDLVEEGLETELSDFTEQDWLDIKRQALANLEARRTQ